VLLQAEYDHQPLAAVMVFARGNRSWYFYGASSNLERNRMPAYLVQWEAMRWAASRGCTVYDLWGIPDLPEEKLEAGFTEKEEGLWSVYRFKRGFGGSIQRSVGAWVRVYHPLLYRLYQVIAQRRSQGDG
jgi:lipid II:glycine glycyltransferase (peptidoglycan interpeptide bridge formation enzyme)